MKRTAVKHEFVEFIPEALEEGILYVSIPYATVVHKCCCGCGREVVTPLSPTDWELRFDGKTISLYPSVGSWSLPCQSHYWIRNDRVIWAPRWTRRQIEAERSRDREAKRDYFEGGSMPATPDEPEKSTKRSPSGRARRGQPRND